MTTLNQIAESIAFSLGEQFNDTLQESIKNDIIEQRAFLIRDDINRNGVSITDYTQSYTVELEKVDKSECPALSIGQYVLKTKQKIAKPLRLKNNGAMNFKSITTVDRSFILSYANINSLKYQTHLPLQDKAIYYSYNNGYLYVLNTLKPCKLLIEGVIADPREINDCNNPNVFPDDIEFPIGKDMLPRLKAFIKQNYAPSLIKDEEIKKEKDA